MQQLGVTEVDDYYERLRRALPAVDLEFRKLLNLVTVTETCFFRDPSQFTLLRDHIVPALLTERLPGAAPADPADKAEPVRRAGPFGPAEKTLRIWSAGCSSGEEAYSIALTLWDTGVYLMYPDWRFEIIGTDLNTQVLQKASRGVYSARALRNVEGAWLQRYFERDGTQFRLNDEVRRCVQFEFGNLTQTPMPSNGPQDIVFCKNVAIYFRSAVMRHLVRGLHDTLTPGGYLVLGHSESLWQMDNGFELVEHKQAYCYRKIIPVSPTASAAPIVVVPTFRSALPTANGLGEISEQYDLCLAAFRGGDFDNAESALVELIKSCPTFVPAYLLLGGVYAHRGRYDEARAQAELVLGISELEPRAHLLLGMIAARQCRADEALQSLRRALYLDDSLALAHFWLGNLYRDRGDTVRACHEYENVVRHWERHTLELTEEFASELTAEQIVQFCGDSLQRLRGPFTAKETEAVSLLPTRRGRR
jgi:chemotaxis protein methyltransferase CheR